MSSKNNDEKREEVKNMRNTIKKATIFIIMMTILAMNASAQEALCVGGQADSEKDTSEIAINACDALSSLGYRTTVDLTLEKIDGAVANMMNRYNTKTNTNGVLFFTGHGVKNAIYWYLGYGFYQDGTKPYSSGEYPISIFKLQNTQIAIFLGCETAKTTDNITKYVQRQGATVTTGWVYEIYKKDAPKWSAAFFKKLKAGKTFRESYKYANSLDYVYNERMKTHRVYGDATITGKAVALTPLSLNEIQEEDDFDTRKTISFTISDDDVEKLIINKIKNEFDNDFDVNDYEREISESPDGPIYDYSLMIGDAKTTHGYTAIVEDNNVEIYDNMGDFKEKAKYIIDIQANSCSIANANDNNSLEKLIEKIVLKYKDTYKGFDVSFYSTKKYYNDEEKRIVTGVNIKVEDPKSGAYSIYTDEI